jgi:hypothetical protein
MRSALRDVAAGGVLLVVAALYYWQTRQIQQSSLSDDVGPEGLPLVLAAALTLVALAIAAKGLLLALRTGAATAARDAAVDADAPASLPRALGFLAIGVGYIVLAPYTGFAVGIALLVAAVAIYEGLRPDWRVAAVAAGAGLFFWVVFVKFLGTEQPVGLLF